MLIVLSSSGIVELIHTLFESTRNVPNIVLVGGIGIILATITAFLLTKLLSRPIRTLERAMKKVSEGNFDVKLDTESGFEEMVQITKSFNSMTKELAATETLQTDFVSNVSHEFKTPINAIEGYATLLQNGDVTPEEQSEYVEKILFNTKRLSTRVGNILLLSKIDNQGIPESHSTYRLDEQIRQSILSLEPRWIERETEFDIELDEIEYTGNEPLMIHVWNNLIENAIKFGKRGGLVKIRLTKYDGFIEFIVEDDGPGIPEGDSDRIFGKFYQSDSSHKSEGNGLGLALVKQIVELELGEISVENAESGGARFIVLLKTE
ncbi:MAG: HAMP domain-containing histidine kinase [Clostridia bacterium]|nr:HAMP domain-containing histidine kinase [Clostridia bacterium]